MQRQEELGAEMVGSGFYKRDVISKTKVKSDGSRTLPMRMHGCTFYMHIHVHIQHKHVLAGMWVWVHPHTRTKSKIKGWRESPKVTTWQ